MKFLRILMLLALFCAINFSCGDTQMKKESSPQENSIPSAGEHQKPRFTPKKVHPKPGARSGDSLLKKQKEVQGPGYPKAKSCQQYEKTAI